MPQGHEPGYAYPLLVWLPDGATTDFDMGRAMARLSLRNYVAVLPRAAAGPAAENSVDDAVWDAIDQVRERVNLHRDRIYLVGQGDGGTLAFRLACRHPESFAGVVSLGGGFPLDEPLFARLPQVRRLPMLLCCRRDADAETARRTDRTLRLFHAAGAMLALRIYPEGRGHGDLSRPVLGDVNRWIMEDVCAAPATPAAACTP
jgi:pimeloyl-ACP methyl ester carboxylesterase